MQNCRTPFKHSGHFFLVTSGSPSCTIQVITRQSQMLCAFCSLIFPSQNSVPFCLPPASGEPFPGKEYRGSWRCNNSRDLGPHGYSWVCSTLLCSSLQSQRQANQHHAIALSYGLGQLWLSAKDIIPQPTSRKLLLPFHRHLVLPALW